MQRFLAENYFVIGNALGTVQKAYENFSATDNVLESQDLQFALRIIVDNCATCGLKVSSALANKLMGELKNVSKVPMKCSALSVKFENLASAIHIEMTQTLFMHITSERAVFYDKAELFGGAVNTKFPSIQFDIVEAGNCYACGRSTAVVFHLMRIMETGVQAFGIKLGIPLVGAKVWQVILDEINKKIKTLPAKDPDTVKMSQVSANLYAVKLAWRNEVMHPKDTYTLEEAENLIRQVKIFMEQLATIV